MTKIGSIFTNVGKKAVLLGSGELGKEVAIELQRLGVEVVACDKYDNAPAMQVAHRSHTFSMLDAETLANVIREEKPNHIIPEIEAIATTELLKLESEGYNVTPTARAAWLTMNREGIRRLAAEDLGLKTSPYRFASTKEEFNAVYERFITLETTDKPMLFEVFTEVQDEDKALYDLWHIMKDTSVKGMIKKGVKEVLGEEMTKKVKDLIKK